MKSNFRIGFGYDVHRIVEGRKLILGGIEIPYEKGLLGHSDADALLHSITDAILGAAALGDIGSHFPDTDPKYKNAESRLFVSEANRLINELNFEVANIDSTIVLQQPKLRPYIDAMRKKIAEMLDLNIDQVSVKATTSERMGFAGREEGIQVHSVVLIQAKGN